MNFEVFVLCYLHERSKSVQEISDYFGVSTPECERVVKDLTDDSFLYAVDGGKYRSTPAGMAYVKQFLEENAVSKLPNAIEPEMKYPLYVMSLSKDKRSVMGIYDKRGGRMDVYPVLPDAMCESGYAGAVLLSRIYNSVFFLKMHTITRNGKGTLFKGEDECISLDNAKKELEFLMLTLETVRGERSIRSFTLEFSERRCSLPSVTDGAHIALNELFVLENYFDDASFSEKKQNCFEELSQQCASVKEILDKGRGFSKISKILSADLTELC